MTSLVEPMKSTVVHVLSQEEQPYGSERRSCNYCGIILARLVDGRDLWGGTSALSYVGSWEDWRAHPNNCGVVRVRERRGPDVYIEHVDSNNGNVSVGKTAEAHEGTPLLVAYVGGLDQVKDTAIRTVLGDFVTGMGYLFTTHERDITATVPETDLPRVLSGLRKVSGVTIKLKIGRKWIPATEGVA